MRLKILTTLAMVACVSSSALAQTSGSQQLRVRVPSRIAITPPTDALIDHDETDGDQAFPTQQWLVKANVRDGVTVTFSTTQAFTNTTDATYKRDAQLGLAVASSQGPATWVVNQATDSTDYGSGDEVATVQASSDRVGRAVFDLAVTFITDVYGTFLEGGYVTTVTGTITAN